MPVEPSFDMADIDLDLPSFDRADAVPDATLPEPGEALQPAPMSPEHNGLPDLSRVAHQHAVERVFR